MDWYSIFKFLHVASAVCWVGGGVVLMYQGLLAERAKNTEAQMVVVKQTAALALSWFVPSSLATVLFGIVTATLGGLWSNAWVILGLVGFAATFSTGNFVIRPAADQIAKNESEGKRDAAAGYGAKLLQVAKFDYVMLFTVIADMVLKPAWSDVWVLAVMAVVLVAGAVLFLMPALTAKPAAA
ncbi:MAG TPA: DUF2269 family protein [Devosia sp.]|nr:DUF2269 family protein [Devosia sp.]